MLSELASKSVSVKPESYNRNVVCFGEDERLKCW